METFSPFLREGLITRLRNTAKMNPTVLKVTEEVKDPMDELITGEKVQNLLH